MSKYLLISYIKNYTLTILIQELGIKNIIIISIIMSV